MKKGNIVGLLGMMAGLGIDLPSREYFKFTTDNLKDYSEGLRSGMSDEEAAFEACKACPVASKMSATRRRLWRLQIMEEANEGE